MRCWIALKSCLVVGSLLLTACAGHQTVRLPWPERPEIEWKKAVQYDDDKQIGYCLNLSDADRLARWVDKLDAYRHAVERLR